MQSRREFLRTSVLGVPALGILTNRAVVAQTNKRAAETATAPIVLSTWSHGIAANEAAWETLVGSGALEFALENGFEKENLLTDASRAAWVDWQRRQDEPVRGRNHDTIGMVALDAHRELAGSCTTSGLAWKRHGRVGDSPIIGAALFVDNEVGATCATGHGEAVIRTAGSSYIIERMRAGRSPQDACEDAIRRVVQHVRDIPDLQVGYLALNRAGEIGACSVQPGFQFAVRDGHGSELRDAATF